MAEQTFSFGIAAATLALAACHARATANANTSGVDVSAGSQTTAPEGSAPRQSEAAKSAPPPVQTVAFTRKPPVAGNARVSKSWIGRNLLFTVSNGNAPVTIEHVSGDVEERREDILAATEDRITKMKVAYVNRMVTIVRNGVEHQSVSVVSGKTYVVEKKDGELVISTEQGGRVSQREGDVIAQDYQTLGQQDPYVKAMSDKPIAVGQSVDGLAVALRQDIIRGAQGRVGFGNVGVVLTGTRPCGGAVCGVFAVKLDLGYEVERVSNQSELSGEMLIRTSDSWPVSVSLEGPVVMNGENGNREIQGDGTSRLQVTWNDVQ
jgi:hypothetical protein